MTAVLEAAGGSLDRCVKLTLFLTDLAHFPVVNEIMQRHFAQPYPARTTVQVARLPRDVRVEIDAIAVLD